MLGFGKNKSTESYKGVRDFYPEDQAVQNYIFSIFRKVAEVWGYEEYSASILEPLELYKSKTSEEIVNEQIYSFKDRGGREVALRPEMTPSVSRMVAAKIQELPSPIRLFSIPNLFRYEKPQRGRLREHWQLNVDMFGVSNVYSDEEILLMAADIMKNFGAQPKDFVIKVNSRELLDSLFKKIDIDGDKKTFVYRLLDKKDKITDEEFKKSLLTLIKQEKTEKLLELLYFGEALLTMESGNEAAKNLNMAIDDLRKRGMENIVFTPTLTRGFDYYSGIVFEVYDTNKENPRSIFGGGRYDNFLNNFTEQKVPAIGFGLGDVIMRDFLETHKLLPALTTSTDLFIAVVPETDLEEVSKIAEEFRNKGVNTAVDISGKKLPDQLKSLDRRKIPFVITIGPDEIQKKAFVLRKTDSREEKTGSIDELVKIIKNS